MEYRIDTSDQGLCAHITGRLTFNDHARMRDLISETLSVEFVTIYFDLSELRFIDSAAVGMLLIAHEEYGNRERCLVIRNPTGQVNRVITVAQLSTLIRVERHSSNE